MKKCKVCGGKGYHKLSCSNNMVVHYMINILDTAKQDKKINRIRQSCIKSLHDE